MIADPKAIPYTLGVLLSGTVDPAGKKRIREPPPDGVRATFDVSLVLRITKTPFGPAGADRLTGYKAISPGLIVSRPGRMISGEEPVCTVMLAVVSARFTADTLAVVAC